MAKAPWKMASDKSVRDRVRRLPKDTPLYREAKRLIKEEGDTRAALKVLKETGDVTDAHIEAHERWLDAQRRDPEDFA